MRPQALLLKVLNMAENSGISWTDHTFNPWMGCTKVSPACKNCYAERDMDKRYGKVAWGPSGTRVLTSDDNWKKPLKWNREAGEKGIRYRVFCASLADVFEDWIGAIKHWNPVGRDMTVCHGCGKWADDMDCGGGAVMCGRIPRPLTMDDVRHRLFRLIDSTPNIDWLLLTKRPENILRMWPSADVFDSESEHKAYWPNVWLGTSVENQEYADKRIPELLKLKGLAGKLFLSCEPLLGEVDLRPALWLEDQYFKLRQEIDRPTIDWVIAGGESGPDARPSHPNWFRDLRDQCGAANVPFHFKQWGEWHPECSTNYATGSGTYRYGKVDGLSMLRNGEICLRNSKENPADKAEDVNPFWTSQSRQPNSGYQWMQRIGTKASGRLLDGVLHDAFPVTQPQLT